MMTSWEAGVEEPALETGDHQVPQWEVVALVASEMGLPFVDLPWTSESQQKVNSLFSVIQSSFIKETPAFFVRLKLLPLTDRY